MGAVTYEDRAKDARVFLEELNNWFNGNCYWYRISRVEVCDKCGHEVEDPIGDSCGGYIGDDYFLEEVRSSIKYYRKEEEEVVFVGDVAYMAASCVSW